MEICYLSFWIKKNIQSMQMLKLQIRKTPNPTINETKTYIRDVEAAISELLPLPAWSLTLPTFDDVTFAINSLSWKFLAKIFSRYVKIKRFILSSS